MPDPYATVGLSREKPSQPPVSAHGESGQKVTWDTPGPTSLGESTSKKRTKGLRAEGRQNATQYVSPWDPVQPHSEPEPSSSSITNAGLNPTQSTSPADISELRKAYSQPYLLSPTVRENPNLLPECSPVLEAVFPTPLSRTPSTDSGHKNPPHFWTRTREPDDQRVTHASHGLVGSATSLAVCHFRTLLSHLLTTTDVRQPFPSSFQVTSPPLPTLGLNTSQVW